VNNRPEAIILYGPSSTGSWADITDTTTGYYLDVVLRVPSGTCKGSMWLYPDQTALLVFMKGIAGTTVTGPGLYVLADGDSNKILKADVGDRGKGNTGNGIHVEGNSNILQENDVYASGRNGIEVVGNNNTLLKNNLGDRTKGNVFAYEASQTSRTSFSLAMIPESISCSKRSGFRETRCFSVGSARLLAPRGGKQ
jgi:hypothetical protein